MLTQNEGDKREDLGRFLSHNWVREGGKIKGKFGWCHVCMTSKDSYWWALPNLDHFTLLFNFLGKNHAISSCYNNHKLVVERKCPNSLVWGY